MFHRACLEKGNKIVIHLSSDKTYCFSSKNLFHNGATMRIPQQIRPLSVAPSHFSTYYYDNRIHKMSNKFIPNWGAFGNGFARSSNENVRWLSVSTSKESKIDDKNFDETRRVEEETTDFEDDLTTAEEEVMADNQVIFELQSKIEKLEKEVAESKDKLLRAYAEMENVRVRTKRDVTSAQTYGNQKFAKSLLVIADNLERAISSVPADLLEHDDKSEPTEAQNSLHGLLEGIKMIEKDLSKVFASNGVVPFGEVGDTYDPQVHEAFLQIPTTDYPVGSIAAVMQRGYRFKDRTLRPAQVGTVKENK